MREIFRVLIYSEVNPRDWQARAIFHCVLPRCVMFKNEHPNLRRARNPGYRNQNPCLASKYPTQVHPFRYDYRSHVLCRLEEGEATVQHNLPFLLLIFHGKDPRLPWLQPASLLRPQTLTEWHLSVPIRMKETNCPSHSFRLLQSCELRRALNHKALCAGHENGDEASLITVCWMSREITLPPTDLKTLG